MAVVKSKVRGLRWERHGVVHMSCVVNLRVRVEIMGFAVGPDPVQIPALSFIS